MNESINKALSGWRLHPIWYILFLAFIIRLGWALVIPFNGASDEYIHYQQVRFIYDACRLPVFGPEQDLFVCKYGIHYAPFPGLNYVLSAFLMYIIPVSPETQYIIARLTSVLSGTFTVGLGYLIARKLFPDRPIIILGVPVFLAFLPGFVFVNAYVNSDAYTVLAASLTLYALLQGTDSCWDIKSRLLLGLSLGLVALGKYNGYAVIPIVVLFIFWTMYPNMLRMLKILFTSGIIAFAVCGWWFVRSYYLYGELLGLGVTRQAVELIGWTDRSLAAQELSLWGVITQPGWLTWLLFGFWGVFGHMNVFIPIIFYGIVSIFTVFMFYVLGRRFIPSVLKNRRYSETTPGKMLVIYVLLVFLLLGLVFYTCYNNDYQPQGRYLYPAVVPLALFFMLGLHFFIENWPHKLRNLFFLGITAGFFLFNGVILLFYIGPIYYIR